jgi:PAS domain S-box-containing protein
MSFRLKTILGIAVIEAFTLSLLIWTSLNFLKTSNETALMERASTTAVMFATMSTDAVLSFDLASLDSFIVELLKNPGVVYGRIISSSEGLLAEGGDREVLKRPFAADTNFRSIVDSVYDLESDITIDGHTYGVVQVGMSAKALQNLLGVARNRITILAMGEMALTAIFSLVLGLWLTRQLGSLSEGSRQISKGNLGYQIPIQGSDELARTAGTFNRMSLSLERSYRQLNDALQQAHRTGRELALSEAKMRAVLEGAVDGIITINEDGIIESFNPAAEKIFGYTAQEVIGRNVNLLVPGSHKERHNGYIQRYLKSGKAKIIGIGREVEGERKNGEVFPIELGVSEINVSKKRLFTGITRDVSQRKQTEEELLRYRKNLEQLVEERTQELKDAQQKLVEQAFESGRAELAAMMLHNIGNAVTPLTSQIDTLRNSLPEHVIDYLEKSYEDLSAHIDHLNVYLQDDPRGKEVFAYIGELITFLKQFKENYHLNLEKMTASLDYVSDILSIQQDHELSKKEDRQLTNVNDLIETALKIQWDNLKKRGVAISKNLEADLPNLMVDRNRFIQVLINVIKNACEALQTVNENGDQKRIDLKTSSSQGFITVEISDTGIGIAPNQIQRLFEPGVSKKGSTGFGLYYSKMFMKKSNGQLVIDSPGPGKGTTLKLILKR